MLAGARQAGFSLERRQDVGVPKALGLVAGDFDKDGARDVAVLRDDSQIRVLWATASQKTDPPETLVALDHADLVLPGGGGQCLTAADCDVDGKLDLVVGTNRQAVDILPGRSGRSWGQATSVAAFAASHITAGNLDGDKWPDRVLIRLAIGRAAGGEVGGAEASTAPAINILWGGGDGFAKTRSLPLEIQHAAATAIGDLDGDRHADLAVAVYQGETAYATESRVLFGAGGRQLQRAGHGPRTLGASGVVIALPNREFSVRAIFCNSFGGTPYERVPLLVYWGDRDGVAADRRWEIPFASGYEASAADLNADGFVDLVALNS